MRPLLLWILGASIAVMVVSLANILRCLHNYAAANAAQPAVPAPPSRFSAVTVFNEGSKFLYLVTDHQSGRQYLASYNGCLIEVPAAPAEAK